MRKLLLLLLLNVVGITALNAFSVDLLTAQKVAGNFAKHAINSELRADDLGLVLATPDYYVFNAGSSGFVIIGSDDCFRPVIGYSDEGVFDTDNPSPELMYYLDNLGEGRRAALKASMKTDPRTVDEWTALLNGKEMPARNRQKQSFYLVKTRWNQNSPYNKYSPHNEGEGRSYAGCVATAMSQVMAYWKHPAHGYGNHSYTHRVYGEIFADFAASEYDFDAMGVSINDMSTAEEIDPIAWFMYHCGVAVDMDFSPSGSGAYSQDVPDAVMKYFDYSNRCRYHERSSYSDEEFIAILKDQFDMGWPCYYSGSDTGGSGGHAFVCDGYDETDMFHFNWGWGGSGDGFFVIDNLNVSSYAFNNGQGIVMNYVPREVMLNTAKAPDLFTALPNGDADFSVSLSWINPKATLDGTPLDALDQIVLVRDGEVVKTFDNPIPGEAMEFVDVTGLPIMVDYAVYAVCNGCGGRRANVKGLNLGPTCSWTVKMQSTDEQGWGTGAIKVINSSGLESGVFSAKGLETEQSLELSLGRMSFVWTAPADNIDLSFEILDADNTTIFSYDGPSELMPQGVFYEIVNTCGEEVTLDHPSDLKAQVGEEDVILEWTGIANPGYGYNIYRDGSLYTMVTDTTAFVDEGAAKLLHSYFVTAFCVEGETEPSNEVSTMFGDEELRPRNLDLSRLENGRFHLSWDAPENTENLKAYFLYHKAPGEEYKVVKPLNATTTNTTITTPLVSGDRHAFKVVALYGQEMVESAPARSLKNPDLLYVEANLTHLPSCLTLQVVQGSLYLQWNTAWLAESYNVYCNDELVAEGLTETLWTTPIPGDDEVHVFKVTGVLNGVESSPSNRVYYGPYSINETLQSLARLFPNPSTGWVTVEGESLKEVNVFNLNGQLLRRVVADETVTNLNLSDLDSGVYYVRMVTGNGSQVKKLVLVK